MSSWNGTFSNGFLGLGFLSHGETSGLGFLLFRSPVGSRQENPAVQVAGGKCGGARSCCWNPATWTPGTQVSFCLWGQIISRSRPQ